MIGAYRYNDERGKGRRVVFVEGISFNDLRSKRIQGGTSISDHKIKTLFLHSLGIVFRRGVATRRGVRRRA